VNRPRTALAPLLFALVLAPGCGSGEAREVAASPAVSVAPLRAPALAGVRAALEAGRRADAEAGLAGVQGFEAELLRARAGVLAGDAIAALSALERARKFDAEHPDLYATEAEVLAALERVQAAAELVAAGRALHPRAPALLRAQGVVELRSPGRGRAALDALERARAADPGLPFLAWPLAQAHVLTGRGRLESAPAEATAHALAALALVPALDDARELRAEGLTGERRFAEALTVYAELEARGRSFGDTPAILHQRCATALLLARDSAGAVEHYLAARARGMDDEGLGFGADVLAEEHAAALGRGRAAAAAGDWTTAERELARALELAPGDLVAENHLALARFRREDFHGAAAAWEAVLARARLTGAPLVDPVPLDLAKAWRLAGEPGRARDVLAELLDREPDGPWSDGARELLLALEAEALAGG
jgi:tetratricopeptide (TPR) repeat protein